MKLPRRRGADGRLGRSRWNRLSVLGVTWLLWLLVIAGVAGGAVALSRPAPAAVGVDPEKVAALTRAPSGFAELYVATFLSQAGAGNEDVLRSFYPVPVRLEGVTPGQLFALRTVTVDAKAVAAGYWWVTVGAETLRSAPGGWQPGGIRYFTAGIQVSGGGFVATGLPSQVAAPPATPLPKLRLQNLATPPATPTTEALKRFFAAYLAGAGDLERYISPGSAIRAVTPPPFASVTLRQAAFEESTEAGATLARVEVDGADPAGAHQVLGYVVKVQERGGRPEIAQVLPGVPLKASPAPIPSPQGGTSP